MRFELGKVVQKFNGSAGIEGYILASRSNLHVAVSLAGVLGGVVATESIQAVARAGSLEMLVDSRNLHLEDMFEKYNVEFSRKLFFNQRPDKLDYTTDFTVFGRAFTMFDAKLAGPLAQRALARLEHTSAVLGWGDEKDFVTAALKHGALISMSIVLFILISHRA